MKRPASKSKSPDTLHAHVGSALDGLRQTFTDVVEAYKLRILGEIADIAARTEEADDQGSDLREILNLIRNLQVKPERGRRKDLKKIDSLVGDLNLITENWPQKKHPASEGATPKAPKRSTGRRPSDGSAT
jgi:hypothetical protein